MRRLSAHLLALPLLAQIGGDRTLNVSGDAEVKVVPDRVVLSLGVESRDKVLAAARSRNDAGGTSSPLRASSVSMPPISRPTSCAST